MCGRYALHAHPDVVALQFHLSSVPVFAPRYNIAPAAEVLMVRGDGAALARWQLRGRHHNLRADTGSRKPQWLNLYRSRRCLLPASGFYEWKSAGPRKQPYYVRPARGELFALAGLWDNLAGALSCAVLTTESNGVLARIHDRMPVIVAPEDYARWLGGKEGLLKPAPEGSMTAYPVGDAVNRAALDSPELIAPREELGTRDLFGH